MRTLGSNSAQKVAFRSLRSTCDRRRRTAWNPQKGPLYKVFSNLRLATPGGLEPPTFSLEGCCSILLSYGAVRKNLIPISKLKPEHEAKSGLCPERM